MTALALLSVCGLQAQTLQLSPSEIFKRARPGVPAAPPASAPPAAAAPEGTDTQRPPAPPPKKVAAVAQAYLYLEPNQARFEVLFDAASLQRLIDEGSPLPERLDDALRQRLCKEMAARAETWCALKADGREASRSMAYPVLLTGKPGATQPLEAAQELSPAEALVGLAWTFELPPMPDQVAVVWQGFLPESGRIPASILFGPKSESAEIRRGNPGLTWRNLGRLPRPQPLVRVPEASSVVWRLPLGFVLWCLAGVAAALFARHRRTRLFGGWQLYVILWGAGAVMLWPRLMVPLTTRGEAEVRDPGQAEVILSPLLQNVYRAFDHRSESAIYDVLARSVDGELLRRLYLETIEALSLEGREGARVTVQEFSAEVDEVDPTAAGFVADCQWTALGTVGHWGHAHTRVNRYKARVTVDAVKGEWKLIDLEVQEARRL